MDNDRFETQFQRIADAVEQRQPDRDVHEALKTAHALCAKAASSVQREQVRTLLANVQTALETWQTVWPRLGAQQEFRQAVAREARLWANKLRALTVHD